MWTRVIIVSLLGLSWASCSPRNPSAVADTPTPPVPGPERVVAYYFHGAIRCVTCLEIERIAREAVETRFVQELAADTLEWQSIDYDVEENRHYQDDYKLSMPSLVLVRFQGDEQQDWTILEETWTKISEGEDALVEYVCNELQVFFAR